ncbi:HEAT repeat domain-containing protein [Streptomyces sp. NPDC048479]|uniref:HEAT repeat domain-containing protein n=1 Tax=Streptomyces sp. NPDC048479 TaxID=3154725 RepID=UPI00341C97A6
MSKGKHMSTSVRIVLKPEVSLDDVGVVAYDQQWGITSVTRKNESPRRQAWSTPSRNTSITFLEDPYLGLRYIVVKGPEFADVSRIIRSSLACWTIEEALTFLMESGDRDHKIHGIYLVAASSPSVESGTVLEALRTVSHDADPEVRRALLVAMGYLGQWPVVRSIAESLQNNDPDEGVRRDAGYLLEGLDLPDAQ